MRYYLSGDGSNALLSLSVSPLFADYMLGLRSLKFTCFVSPNEPSSNHQVYTIFSLRGREFGSTSIKFNHSNIFSV